MHAFLDRRGTPWTLRPLTDSDLPAWIRLHQHLVADGRGMILDLDEIAADVAEARTRMAAFLDHPEQHHALVAIGPEGQFGGSCELSRLGRRRIAHVGILAMGIHPDHQGRGLGRALLEATLAWGDTHGIRRVELYCRDDNGRAIALYDSLGFVHEGTRRAFALEPDGSYVDDRIYGRVR